MKDEIKEILEELKEKKETYKECSENGIIENEYYKSHILLDYITNLQQENERLKEQNKMSDEQIEKTFEVVSEHIYKSRIDKAIKIIKDEIEHCDSALSNSEYTIVSKHDLLKQEKECCIKQLNILQGVDKE